MPIYISVVVSRDSQIVENVLLSVDEPFLIEDEAVAFREQLDQWMATLPVPGQVVVKPEKDSTTELAMQLSCILEGRDPALFSLYYEDPEHDAAQLEKRPYDAERLEIFSER